MVRRSASTPTSGFTHESTANPSSSTKNNIFLETTMECIGQYANNCVLVAIKEISGRSDEDILTAVRRYGYKENHGMHCENYDRAIKDLGIECGKRIGMYEMMMTSGEERFTPITVSKILKRLQRGCWLVRTRGHLFVVRAGRLVDPNFRRRAALGRHVVDIVEVFNPYSPKVKGLVTYHRSNPKKFLSASWKRYQEMVEYIKKYGPIEKEILFKNTSYHAGDYRFDLERGNIKLV